MDLILSTAYVAAAITGAWLLLSSTLRRKRLPPGPRRLPIIGNAHQMPTDSPWLTFEEWGKTYGDIMHVDVFGKSVIILNSRKVAQDLLDKRSSIYSDRPHFMFAGDLAGFDLGFPLKPYGESWRKQRRMVAQDFSQSMVPRYFSLQEKEAAILVRNLIKDPSNLSSEIKLRIGIIILRVTYGYYLQSADDPFLTLPLESMDNFSQAIQPGNFLVDFVPALKYIPRWIPGSGFLNTADDMRKVMWDSTWNIYDWCKTNINTGKTLMPNLCATYIQEAGGDVSMDGRPEIGWAATSVMGGGLDTNMSSALTFLMAMILHPDVQVKAQAELDAVIGKDRLPTISDKSKLPYLRSVMAEALRWGPAGPLGVAHATSQDDVYEGYDIPEGAFIIPNIWHMLHDPEVYPNPMQFNPDRFGGLDSEMKKVTDVVFGFGRRVCPGMHFAEGTLFAIIATTLYTCKILPGLDNNGNEVLPRYAYSGGTISFPEDFSIRLQSRSARAHDLLSEVPDAIE